MAKMSKIKTSYSFFFFFFVNVYTFWNHSYSVVSEMNEEEAMKDDE